MMILVITATGLVMSGTLPASAATIYLYDRLERLTNATYTDGAIESFAYDRAGNRTNWNIINPLTISAITNRVVSGGTNLVTIPLIIGSVNTPAENLTVSVRSSNPSLIDKSELILSGAGANRSLTIDPIAQRTGSTTITVIVSDGSIAQATRFTLTITPSSQRPTAPKDLRMGPLGTTGLPIDLNWSPSDFLVGTAGEYQIYMDDTLLGTTLGTNFPITMVTPNSLQCASVIAVDDQGQASLPSLPLCFTYVLPTCSIGLTSWNGTNAIKVILDFPSDRTIRTMESASLAPQFWTPRLPSGMLHREIALNRVTYMIDPTNSQMFYEAQMIEPLIIVEP